MEIQNMIVENAKVMAKRQNTLPRDIRNRLGVGTGDRVTLICEGDKVVVMNAAVYAMRALQRDMEGAFEKAGINTEDDVMALVKKVCDAIEGL